MSYNGSGTFLINTSGQPVVTGTPISSTVFNALTADLATGLSTAITKDGQTATTARIPFAQGISSTLVTDSSSTNTGSIITGGGVGIAKALYVGTALNVAGASTMTGSIAVDSVTDSTSTTTGSIQTDGGVGIAKALFVGTTANVAGAVTLQSTLGVTGVTTFSAQPIFSSLTASSAVATDASKGLVSVTNTGTGNNVLATSPTLVTPVLGAASATSVTVAAGAVGTPSITTAGDTNTGIFFPAADTIAFSEGGAEAMRIDSSGNVGIGTTSPARTLHVKAGGVTTLANSNGALFTDASNAGVLLGSDNVLGYISGVTVAGNATADLVLQPFGASVLVGTTSASNTAGVGIKFIPTATAPGTFTVFNTSGGENTYHLYNTNATNNGYRFYVNVNGGILNYSGNNSNLSDVRTKTNIVLSGSYLEKICAIPVKQFNYKDEADGTQQTLGVIAQDVEAVAPELVNTEGFGETPEDGIPLKAVYTTDMQFALMKCIQEQQALITALTTRITALESAP